MIRVLGVDPSLTSTGFAYRDGSVLKTGHLETGKLRGCHRLVMVREKLKALLGKVNPQVVVYEGYALGAGGRMNNNVFHLGELGGVLRTAIWEAGIDLLEVGPTTLKSLIALDGRAKKPEVIAALRLRFGFNTPHDDEADALALLLVGEMRHGQWRAQHAQLDSKRRKALDACEIHRGRVRLS